MTIKYKYYTQESLYSRNPTSILATLLTLSSDVKTIVQYNTKDINVDMMPKKFCIIVIERLKSGEYHGYLNRHKRLS